MKVTAHFMVWDDVPSVLVGEMQVAGKFDGMDCVSLETTRKGLYVSLSIEHAERLIERIREGIQEYHIRQSAEGK